MAEQIPPPRSAPERALPPYAYVPGHGLPHPVNDPGGHLHPARDAVHEPPISGGTLSALPTEPAARREALAAALCGNPAWRFAIDLFNEGFYWEAHEAWETFWHALGRTTPEARFVQGLIHLAAAGVKVREGRPAGVAAHARRAGELMGQLAGPPGWANDGAARSNDDAAGAGASTTLGLVPESIAAVLSELATFRPACWHTSRCPVVRVLAAGLRLAQ